MSIPQVLEAQVIVPKVPPTVVVEFRMRFGITCFKLVCSTRCTLACCFTPAKMLDVIGQF